MSDIYKQARDIENRARSYIDNPGSNECQALLKEARDLYESIEMKKSPDHVEDRVERVMDRVKIAKNSGHVSFGDADDLEDRLRDLQQILRKM